METVKAADSAVRLVGSSLLLALLLVAVDPLVGLLGLFCSHLVLLR